MKSVGIAGSKHDGMRPWIERYASHQHDGG
jgi:hypothetical protein